MKAQPRQTRVRRSPEERRTQILEEALRLIGERGFYGLTIRELARRCRMTDPGLLHHFGSKEELLVALLELRDRRDDEAVRSLAGLPVHAPSLTHGQVIDVLRAIVLRNSTQPEFVRLYAVLQAEALHRGHPAHDYFVARDAVAIERIAQIVAPFAPTPRSTAVQLIALMKGLELEWLRSDQKLDIVGEWDDAAARLLP
jgi:AcrR family transcriptional regulator